MINLQRSTKLTTLAAVDNDVVKNQKNLLSSDFGTRFHREVPLYVEISKFPKNTVLDTLRVAYVPKISLIHSATLIEFRLVMDRRTPDRII